MRTRLAWLPTAAAILALALAQAPAAQATPLATVTAATPVSGGGGWLVWSLYEGSVWSLVASHDGAPPARLPVAPRPQPFDASVGTGADGAPVVVFSRCRRTPTLLLPGEADGALIDPSDGAGCRIRLLELGTMRERAVAVPHPAAASDTTPAISRGVVVFARRPQPRATTWRILRFSPRRPRRLTVLPHGAVAPCSGRSCREERVGGQVEALAFDGRRVAFVWELRGGFLTGEEAWEDRIDQLGHSRGTLAGTQIGTESCAEGGPVEEEWPLAPVLAGRAALFAADLRGNCFTRFATGFIRERSGRLETGALPKPALALASDGTRLYALLAPVPVHGASTEASCTAAAPCSLEALALPPLRRRRHAPAHPFL
jgi:hypothetical protein